MTTTTAPQLALTRIFNAPRAAVYQAFTDPDHLATWWGPIGNSLPRDEIEFDVRPGGYQRWTEVFPADPGIRVHIHLDLTEVVDGELLDGIMRVSGQLPGGFEPFETQNAGRVPRRGRRADATRDPPVASRASGVPQPERVVRGVHQAGRGARRMSKGGEGERTRGDRGDRRSPPGPHARTHR